MVVALVSRSAQSQATATIMKPTIATSEARYVWNRHDRIVAQFVMVVEVLVAERDPVDPLPDQRRNPMLDVAWIATVHETRGKAIDQPNGTVRGSQQQRPGVRRDPPAIKSGDNNSSFDGCKLEQFRATLCRHRGAPRIVS